MMLRWLHSLWLTVICYDYSVAITESASPWVNVPFFSPIKLQETRFQESPILTFRKAFPGVRMYVRGCKNGENCLVYEVKEEIFIYIYI